MGLNQAEFAALGGVVMNSQNRYEAGATEPGASYLANLAAAGVDVMFLLTGRHLGGKLLDEEASRLVGHLGRVDAEVRRSLLIITEAIAGEHERKVSVASERPRALHERKSNFKGSGE